VEGQSQQYHSLAKKSKRHRNRTREVSINIQTPFPNSAQTTEGTYAIQKNANSEPLLDYVQRLVKNCTKGCYHQISFLRQEVRTDIIFATGPIACVGDGASGNRLLHVVSMLG
jgi:hypothetical protein